MLVTNNTSNYYYLGSDEYPLPPGGSVTVPDAVYNNDDSVASAINSLDTENSVTVTSPPSGYPRITGETSQDSAHLADTSDAHDASAISVLDSGGNFTGTDVEAVLAELSDSITAWTNVIKTANESVDTNTTPQDDNHLFFATEVGAVYQIEGLLIYSNAAGTTPDLKTVWGEDTTIRGFIAAHGVSNTDSNFTGYAQTNQTATIILGTVVADRHATIVGHHVGNGGTFRLQWAQNVSNGTATILKAGSYLRYRRVS